MYSDVDVVVTENAEHCFFFFFFHLISHDGTVGGGGVVAHLIWVFKLGCVVERVPVVVAPELALVPAIRHRRPGRVSETVSVAVGFCIGVCVGVPRFARVLGGHAFEPRPREHAVAIGRRRWAHGEGLVAAGAGAGRWRRRVIGRGIGWHDAEQAVERR